LDGRNKPVELKDVISAQKQYAKTIKEQPEHFNEGYTLFDTLMTDVSQDPYDD
jgi:hypothetical protein